MWKLIECCSILSRLNFSFDVYSFPRYLSKLNTHTLLLVHPMSTKHNAIILLLYYSMISGRTCTVTNIIEQCVSITLHLLETKTTCYTLYCSWKDLDDDDDDAEFSAESSRDNNGDYIQLSRAGGCQARTASHLFSRISYQVLGLTQNIRR